MKPTLLLTAAAALISSATLAQTLMSQADVEAALKGQTFVLTTQDGFTAKIAFNPDMTAVVTNKDGSTDSGTYRFAEGGYCSTWRDFRNGAEACFIAEDLGGGRYQLYKPGGARDDLLVRQ